MLHAHTALLLRMKILRKGKFLYLFVMHVHVPEKIII